MKISTILDHIDSGHMALPEFQRGYVWNRDQVRSLFDSLYRRHPVGGLLVWATESSTADHRGYGQLAAGVVKLLLDGQQRVELFDVDLVRARSLTFVSLFHSPAALACRLAPLSTRRHLAAAPAAEAPGGRTASDGGSAALSVPCRHSFPPTLPC